MINPDKVVLFIDKNEKNILTLAKQIAAIPSPTFAERKKILFLQQYLSDLGYKTCIDKAGNLTGRINQKIPSVLVVAHTDTVLTPEKKVREDDKYLYGHGVCDNTAGVVALLTILKVIKKFNLDFPRNLKFAFTVAEEGLGAKSGMKYLMKENKQIKAVLNLESHNLGRIVNQSPGQYRVKISLEALNPGHSFRDFGNPNPIVIASQVISDFAKLPGFIKKETTFNVGFIQGGQGINSIPKKAEFFLEVRSIDQRKLSFLKNNLDKLLKQHKEIKITQQIIADSQAASLPQNHKIYKLVQKVHKNLGIKSFFDLGNNDGEVSLVLGIPTVTVGSSLGYKTHSQDEYLDKHSLILGIKQELMVVVEILEKF